MKIDSYENLPSHLKKLTAKEVAMYLRAFADGIERAFDMGFPIKAIEEADARANLFRMVADDLDGK